MRTCKKYNQNKLFFDIGGGNGFVAKGLQSAGIETILVEPGLHGAQNAKKRGVENVICSTLQDAGFKSSTIPSAGMFDVIEHIEDDIEFLSDLNGYLQDDGLIYITVPAYNFLWSEEDIEAGHFRRYSLSQIKNRIKGCGYHIEYATYIFSILPLPIFLLRTLPSWLGLNKNSESLKKHQKAHKQKKGLVEKFSKKIWNWELNKVFKGKQIPLGTSCFVVARKKM